MPAIDQCAVFVHPSPAAFEVAGSGDQVAGEVRSPRRLVLSAAVPETAAYLVARSELVFVTRSPELRLFEEAGSVGWQLATHMRTASRGPNGRARAGAPPAPPPAREPTG